MLWPHPITLCFDRAVIALTLIPAPTIGKKPRTQSLGHCGYPTIASLPLIKTRLQSAVKNVEPCQWPLQHIDGYSILRHLYNILPPKQHPLSRETTAWGLYHQHERCPEVCHKLNTLSLAALSRPLEPQPSPPQQLLCTLYHNVNEVKSREELMYILRCDIFGLFVHLSPTFALHSPNQHSMGTHLVHCTTTSVPHLYNPTIHVVSLMLHKTQSACSHHHHHAHILFITMSSGPAT